MNKDFINILLDACSDITMNYFNSTNLHIEIKDDETPVSKADKDCETVIRGLIKQSYPNHGIIGEEFGSENASFEYVWIIDPIDGTMAFINGEKTFANMVCLLKNGVPVLSGVGFPAKGERYISENGKTYLNEIITTVGNYNITDCKISYTGDYIFNDNEKKIINNISNSALEIKIGGDAYNYCRMVAGDNLFVVESDLKPYDYLPLVPIIKNAGGYISDWLGNDLNLNSGNQVLATPFKNNDLIGKINE